MTSGRPARQIDGKFLRTCDPQVPRLPREPFVVVIFGGAGDLSRRMLIPTLFHIYQEGKFPDGSEIIGIGLPDIGSDRYQKLMTEAIHEFDRDSLDAQDLQEFGGRLSFISGNFDSEDTYRRLASRIEKLGAKCEKNLIYYLAVPPGSMESVVTNLEKLKLCRGRFKPKVIIEKPFGHDRKSAAQLNQVLLERFNEDQIYRMDYFLGKETVQNILFFRFANSIFEEIWNSQHIDSVQITVSEELGIESRGQFYEQTGIVRDMLQNHVLQIMGLVAMEPPLAFDAEFIRDEKVKLFRSVRPFDPDYIDDFAVRGQYGPGKIQGKDVPGYRQEANVSEQSAVPTFFAGKFFVDNWRWAGVPFYIRTGKRMAKFVTEVWIQFKQPPLRFFGCQGNSPEPNILHLVMEPQETISLHMGVRHPFSANQIYATNLVFSYQDAFNLEQHPPYEKLLVDCLQGDMTLFTRQDGVEALWEIVDPLTERWESEAPAGFPNYAAGAWGPPAADDLLERDGRSWLTS